MKGNDEMAVYTIGHRENYLQYIADTAGQGKKLGPRDSLEGPDGQIASYDGGIVFEDVLGARACLRCHNKLGYSVFELEGEWVADTKWDGNDGHRITRDLRIVREVPRDPEEEEPRPVPKLV
jgi:hypothetical protein